MVGHFFAAVVGRERHILTAVGAKKITAISFINIAGELFEQLADIVVRQETNLTLQLSNVRHIGLEKNHYFCNDSHGNDVGRYH